MHHPYSQTAVSISECVDILKPFSVHMQHSWYTEDFICTGVLRHSFLKGDHVSGYCILIILLDRMEAAAQKAKAPIWPGSRAQV